jgi:hypothetical protein
MRRDVTTELKELRLHGMVGAWTDLTDQGDSQVATSKCGRRDDHAEIWPVWKC